MPIALTAELVKLVSTLSDSVGDVLCFFAYLRLCLRNRRRLFHFSLRSLMVKLRKNVFAAGAASNCHLS